MRLQKYDFTAVPNILIDFYLAKLTGSEFAVLIYLCRRIYGFQKGEDKDRISLEQICRGIVKRDGIRLDYGTGLSRSAAIEALKTLRRHDLVLVEDEFDGIGRRTIPTYRLNIEEGVSIADLEVQNLDHVVQNLDQLEVQNLDHLQKKVLQKKVITQNIDIPIVPLPKEPERTDLYEPPAEEAESFDVIKVDNYSKWLDTVFDAMGRTKPTLPGSKLRDALLERIRTHTKEKVVDEMGEYFNNGGRSLDDFIRTWGSSPVKRNGRTDAFSGSRSVPSRSADRSFDRKAALGSVQRERYSAEKPQPPEEAMRWNQMVPSRKWTMWGSVLHQALQDRLADGDFASRYDAMLDKCAKIAEINHSCSEYLTFAWLLKQDNWMLLMNGACDWLLKSEKKGKSKEVDTSMDELIRPKKEKK